MTSEERWKQRFDSFRKAYVRLTEAIEEYGDREDDIYKEGIIQRFEYTHELAQKVMQDFLKSEGVQNVTGSRSATREFYARGLLSNGEAWMQMIDTRNRSVHTYDEKILKVQYLKIVETYHELLGQFRDEMLGRL